ncbi:Zinc finger CCCH domain-containing protein 65, partial [Mucuna pruriens]
GDRCQFSHDVVPLTKSKPCTHFARHSCMKGDDCPFDHQLSKYPCNKFVSKGFCSRGGACLFSHQVPTNKDIPTPSNVSRPELKSPHLSGNVNFSTPLNNHGSSSVQQSHFTNSAGIRSCISVEHKVTDTTQKLPIPPKGITFVNLAKLSSSPSTPKQGTVTTKESPVQIGTSEDQSAFDKTQNQVEIPKKLPAVTPKGINFLSFGKGSVYSRRSPICSNVNRENGIKLPQLLNFGLPEQTSLSLNKDDKNKASDRANVSQTDIFLNDILEKNKYVAEAMKSKFPEKTSVDVSMRDHNHSKSVQEEKKASDNSLTSDVTSATLNPFVSNQSSEREISGYHKQASSSSQRALLSTLAFAAEHQFDIKMKCPTGGSQFQTMQLLVIGVKALPRLVDNPYGII